MNPENDVVCSLLETPFSRWREEDKRDLLVYNRPTPHLSLSIKNKKSPEILISCTSKVPGIGNMPGYVAVFFCKDFFAGLVFY